MEQSEGKDGDSDGVMCISVLVEGVVYGIFALGRTYKTGYGYYLFHGVVTGRTLHIVSR